MMQHKDDCCTDQRAYATGEDQSGCQAGGNASSYNWKSGFPDHLAAQGMMQHMRIIKIGSETPINTIAQWSAAMDAVNGQGPRARFEMTLAPRRDESYDAHQRAIDAAYYRD